MLTQADIDKCREAFERFDKDGSGSIDAWELKETLKAMGQNPTEEEVRLGLEGNLCRCTGYHNIVKSVLAAAKAK